MNNMAIFTLAMIFTLSACSADRDGNQTTSVPMRVKIVQNRHVQEHETITVSATSASPAALSNVSFLVSGKVIQIGPRNGEYVKRGQLLAMIDTTDYALTAAQTAVAQLELARIMYKRSRDEYHRMKMLYDSNSLSPNDLRKFKVVYKSAKQQLDQAVANELITRKRLSDTTLYSPVNGFISKRLIEPGEMASPGRPVFEIVQLDPVKIKVGMMQAKELELKSGP